MIGLKTVRSMIYGLATADALGVPVEFMSRARLRQNPVVDMRSGGVWDQPAGTWSDDTSMALATMESIGRLKKIDLDDIMNNFVEWLENDEFTAGNHTFDARWRSDRRLRFDEPELERQRLADEDRPDGAVLLFGRRRGVERSIDGRDPFGVGVDACSRAEPNGVRHLLFDRRSTVGRQADRSSSCRRIDPRGEILCSKVPR